MNESDIQLRTANYSGFKQHTLSGAEKLMDSGDALPFDISDYWKWAYSDLLRNTQRGVFAEFIVKAALDIGGCHTNDNIRSNFEPFDLVGPDILVGNKEGKPGTSIKPSRIEVKSAAYVQAWEPHKGTTPKISFSIATAKEPDEQGDYRPGAESKRNSEIYVFCLYTPKERDKNILDMNLWEFYVVRTSILNEKCNGKKTITLSGLESLGINRIKYIELFKAITDACSSISENTIKLYT